jgi:hypothetical protein
MLAEWVMDGPLRFDGTDYDLSALDLRRQLELLAALAAVRRLCMPLLARLFAACELPPAVLFRDYVSKNVLNHFRQDRGYKRGEYKKTWDGLEDNVHMAQLLVSITAPDEHLPDALYRALAARYDQLSAAGKLG